MTELEFATEFVAHVDRLFQDLNDQQALELLARFDFADHFARFCRDSGLPLDKMRQVLAEDVRTVLAQEKCIDLAALVESLEVLGWPSAYLCAELPTVRAPRE